MTAVLPQPSACASCGQPFTAFCTHTRQALAELTAPKRDYFAEDIEPMFASRLLDEVDAIVSAEDPDAHSFSQADIDRYCTRSVHIEPRRARTRRNS